MYKRSRTSKPRQIAKKIQLYVNSPEYRSYMKKLEAESKDFWSSPTPSPESFNRYQLGSGMLPPFQTPPDNSKLLELMSGNTPIQSIKIETDYSNSTSISLESGTDDMMFSLE